jgi:hypothetical protein
MTYGSSDDLFHGSLAASEASGVIFRGKISDQRRYAKLRAKQSECLLQESSFPCTGTGHETHDENACFTKSLAKCAGNDVVLPKYFFSHFNDAGL